MLILKTPSQKGFYNVELLILVLLPGVVITDCSSFIGTLRSWTSNIIIYMQQRQKYKSPRGLLQAVQSLKSKWLVAR